jgi:Icc protein
VLKSFSAPVYCVLGNHDDPEAARSVYPLQPISMDDHCLLRDWHILLLAADHAAGSSGPRRGGRGPQSPGGHATARAAAHHQTCDFRTCASGIPGGTEWHLLSVHACHRLSIHRTIRARDRGEAPGYRWINLYPNGRFDSDVRRVTFLAS